MRLRVDRPCRAPWGKVGVRPENSRLRTAVADERIRSKKAFGLLVATAAVVIIVAACLYLRKAADDRSAFIRWIDLVQGLVAGRNVYVEAAYPNPPLMAIVLYPLSLLPPVVGAMCWFTLKVVMAVASLMLAVRMACGERGRLSPLAWAAVVALSARPLLSDLHHGNVNILILFTVVASLWAYHLGRDWLCGLGIALGTTFKVTPALFIPYFAWKREWRVVAWSLIGLVLWIVIVPSAVVGFRHNLVLFRSWTRLMIEPYVLRGEVETLQINQSLPGVLYRLTTFSPGIEFEDDHTAPANILNLSRTQAWWLLRILTAGILAWMAYVCRTPTDNRKDWRLTAEFAIVVLGMLFFSERTWKHHYVTLCLPVAVLVAAIELRYRSRPLARRLYAASLGAAFLLMASTSSELAGWLGPGGYGHKYMQAGGAFFWAGVVLLCSLSCLLLDGNRTSAGEAGHSPPVEAARPGETLAQAA